MDEKDLHVVSGSGTGSDSEGVKSAHSPSASVRGSPTAVSTAGSAFRAFAAEPSVLETPSSTSQAGVLAPVMRAGPQHVAVNALDLTGSTCLPPLAPCS